MDDNLAVNIRIRVSNGLEIRTYIVGIDGDSDIATKLIIAKKMVEKLFKTKNLATVKFNLSEFT